MKGEGRRMGRRQKDGKGREREGRREKGGEERREKVLEEERGGKRERGGEEEEKIQTSESSHVSFTSTNHENTNIRKLRDNSWLRNRFNISQTQLTHKKKAAKATQ